MFLPFTSGFGRNITVGENVFSNAGCRFQDQGGTMHPAKVEIGPRAWIGSGAIIVPGVTIGEGSIIGAGSVVTGDVAPMTVVVGSPARQIRPVESGGAAEER